MSRLDRPLSPHLGVYRWQITNTLSILHRLTGVMLTLGAVILTVWLLAMAGGPESYRGLVRLLGSPLGKILLFGWTFSFFFHLCNGIRHLFWDAGYGFEMRQAQASGMTVVIATVVLTIALWLVALTTGGS
jgi:succinate dehydrogenase / fumarate reductase, cytochrome b subunit